MNEKDIQETRAALQEFRALIKTSPKAAMDFLISSGSYDKNGKFLGDHSLEKMPVKAQKAAHV